MSFLEMDIRFSTMEVEWDSHTMPFKKHDARPLDAYHIRDSELMSMAKDRVKEILDTKYEPANLEKVCTAQSSPACGTTTEVVGPSQQVRVAVRWNVGNLARYRSEP